MRAWPPGRRRKHRKSQKMHFQEFWDSFAQNKTSEISKNARSGILGLLGAEQDVGNLKKCTFRNSVTPVRRTRRRKPQRMHFQEFWDSCAQNKTSEISKNALSGILGFLGAEQDVGNIKKSLSRILGPLCAEQTSEISKMGFQEVWHSCAQNNTSEISKNALSGILGLLCAERNAGHLKQCTFRNSGTRVRIATRRRSKQMYSQKFWDSFALNEPSEI